MGDRRPDLPPLLYAHLDMEPGAIAEIPRSCRTRAPHPREPEPSRSARNGPGGRLLVLDAAASKIRAVELSSVMVLGGRPLGRERYRIGISVLPLRGTGWRKRQPTGRPAASSSPTRQPGFIPLPNEPRSRRRLERLQVPGHARQQGYVPRVESRGNRNTATECRCALLVAMNPQPRRSFHLSGGGHIWF